MKTFTVPTGDVAAHSRIVADNANRLHACSRRKPLALAQRLSYCRGMLELWLGVCLGVAFTLATQWLMKHRKSKTSKPAKTSADVLEFPARPAESTGFLDSILEEETDDEVVERLRRNLRVKVFHNEEQFNRLIESEKRRQPDASTRILLEGAIERWERDNR